MITSLINAISAQFPMLEQGFYIDLNWLGKFVKVIVDGIGNVGVGVIVFTLILKAITTPFDVYQRYKMRKQNLIMKQMQPDLEKLQKQYANDKTTYNMKMMELQKKNGYSMFGACLPMIISLVILIVAVTAFQTYSQDANLSIYEKMATAYNNAVKEYTVDGKDYHFARGGSEGEENADDGLLITVEKFTETNSDGQKYFTEDGIVYTYFLTEGSEDDYRIRVESEDARYCLFYTYSPTAETVRRTYSVNVDRAVDHPDEEVRNGIKALIDGGQDPSSACVSYFKNRGAQASAAWFKDEKNQPKFLWIANVWYPDVSYKHPVQPDYEEFKRSFTSGILPSSAEGGRSIEEVIPKEHYESLTSQLTAEMEQPNGYFILIVLTIGLMVLSQFITMRSQKEMNRYQTVDGRGAKTQKIMMIVMPLIYAITGFLWTAAFSIYIAMSSIIGIVVTLLTNLVLARIFSKKEEAQIKERYTRTAPWMQDDGKKKKKDRKNQK